MKTEDIHTYYGDSYILQGITMEVPKGTVLALLGRNGMGKTTFIRSVAGFVTPRRGRILFKGVDVTNIPDYRRIRMGMGLVPQGRLIFPSLTVQENVLIGARGKGEWNLESIYAAFPRLKERARHMGNKLSGGEQQMLAIARALMMNPEFLLMDEPTEGLAPMFIRDVVEIIQSLKKKGSTILLVEQNLSMALELADVVHVLNRGRIVFSSDPRALWQNEEVKRMYLGI